MGKWENRKVGKREKPLTLLGGKMDTSGMAKPHILQADGKGRITLPPEVRKRSEGLFTYEMEEGGTIRLKPVLGLVTPDQAYFWTRRWQEGEYEASRDIRDGRLTKVPHRKLKKFLAKL